MHARVRRLVISAFAVGACGAAVSATAAAQGAEVTLLGYHSTPPASWTVRKPSSTSRLAQYVIPGPDAASGAEVVVYYFGGMQGGNVEANLTRWREQLSTTGDAPVYEHVTRDSSGASPVTIAEYRGTYQRGIGAGSTDSVRTGQTLVSAIVETPHGTMFFQLFGASAVVATQHDAFVKFVKDLK